MYLIYVCICMMYVRSVCMYVYVFNIIYVDINACLYEWMYLIRLCLCDTAPSVGTLSAVAMSLLFPVAGHKQINLCLLQFPHNAAVYQLCITFQ